MEKSIYFDKHFEKFINNDVSVRHYFKCKVVDLKRNHPTVFTSMKKSTGIKLVNDEPETINKAKEILYNVYLLKQSAGQGRTLSDNFKVLKDDKLVEIMKDRSLTFGERCEKVNNIIKKSYFLNQQGDKGVKENENQLTYKQIEQYIYRNYSDYKPIKVKKFNSLENQRYLVPESSEERLILSDKREENQSEIIPESSEESQESQEIKDSKPTQPEQKQEQKPKDKFKEFKTDEIVKLLEQHTSKAAFKILYERFKDKYTETQIRNYIARYKMKYK